ncbi:Coenzyme F420 hydrogenase/dehydrogenase, beta subunit C-terminal domain [Clostridium perfringens]|uniref:Coenzyme F420 hydrogenase/dehydrogenase, beta subunit C-terminal domain n=1 Tax=Clostridium perfringens TaxID=1502 RepID=UPI000D70D389|nr:Coenzyme F420 hydrogenase/dehydrogenase, beta subunit C-terminal domain [Clostridium perfringens]PWX48079.1 hypothetical protein CYK61_12500 [Clostridium perfringens]
MCNKSVKKLIDNNLCYQCGTCKSICPTSAITMKRIEEKGCIYPIVDSEKCINCGQCLSICPINNIDLEEEHIPKNSDFIGIYNCTDKERFDFTASGGIVTETIKYLFSEKKINKAIVTGMDENKPINSKVYIVENSNSLKNVSGSVYQPSSVNEILDKINENDRVAFVGLPCHIRGLNLFLRKRPKLKNSFVIKIGLICTIGRGKHGTNLTLDKSFKLKKYDNIKKIIYRYGMPPGNTRVYLKDGSMIEKSCMEIYRNTDYIFMPKGCLFCTDLFNDEADITVGDPWGMNKGKKAMVIVRNQEAKNILNEMCRKELIVFDEEITAEQCVKTQSHSVNYKIYNYKGRISAYKKIGVKIPNIKNISYEKNTIKESIGYNLLMVNSILFNTKLGYKVAKCTPSKILYKYRDKISGVNVSKRRG